MKNLKLNGTTGGFPLFQNDFEFLQESYREIIADICKGFGADIVILNGITPLATTYSTGAIYFQGEIYSIADVLTSTISGKTLHINTSYSTLDPTIYKDASSKNVHEIRTMEWLTASGSPEDTGISIVGIDSIRFGAVVSTELLKFNILQNSLSNNSTFINNQANYGWTNLTLNPSYAGVETPQFRVIGNKVEFRGTFIKNSLNTGAIFTNISPIYNPTVAKPALLLVGTTQTKVVRVDPTDNIRDDGFMSIGDTFSLETTQYYF